MVEQAVAADPEAVGGTPDFDSYPLRHGIEDARPIPGGVSVLWDDGLECRYHVFWLRENAPDPQTTHPVTREQALQLIDLPDDLSAVSAAPDPAGHRRTGDRSQAAGIPVASRSSSLSPA